MRGSSNEPLLSQNQIPAAHHLHPQEERGLQKEADATDNYASSQEWWSIFWRFFLPGRAALGDCWGLERLNHSKGLQVFSNGHQHTALPVLL